MKRLLIVLFVALQAGALNAQSTTEKLDEYLTAVSKLNKFNGVAFVAKDGKILLQKGYGWRDAKNHVAHDGHSIFQIGSITKQFTATIILYLQERGKLSVKDKLSKYIPDFPRGNDITLENLLTHTSGVFNYTNDTRFMNMEAGKSIDIEKLIDLFKDKPLDFEPGSKYSYSNSGYILLGYIIQKVLGKPYEQMVREVIFTPLQMQHSGFDFKNLRSPEKSVGYFALNSDTLPAPIVDSSVSFSAGAIYTTADDLYKWHKALYTDKVIKQSSLEQAFTPFKNKYGFGWIIDTVRGKRIITHNGGIFGFTADMLRVPVDSVCIILLSNKPEALGGITQALSNILYDQPYTIPQERVVIQVPDSVLQKYVGEYELTPDFKITITLENGKLKGQATGQGKVELYAQRSNYFFLKVVDAQVEFIYGADGEVYQLILHQGGAHQPGKKIK